MNPQDNLMNQGVPQMIMPDQASGQISSRAALSNQQANMADLGAVAVSANQATPKSSRKEESISTQATLLISELRDNVVIMKDGSFRAVIACKSINFDLMSEQEKISVEEGFVQFLNTLRYPVQIYVQSRTLNLKDIISEYKERIEVVQNDIETLFFSDM